MAERFLWRARVDGVPQGFAAVLVGGTVGIALAIESGAEIGTGFKAIDLGLGDLV